jgi:hypothetical protein
MALHTKVDGDGSDGQRLAVDPLLAGEVERGAPTCWPTRPATTPTANR